MEKTLAALKSYWILILIVVLFAAGLIGYFAGYRLDQGGITRVGTLVLTGLPDGTAVYLDQARRVYASDGTAHSDFLPGTHSVIVDSPGNQPWNELFTISPSEQTTLAPIFVPVTLAARPLSGEDAARGLALVRAAKLPTKAAPLTLADGCTLLYASGARLIADAATSSCAVLPEYLCAPDAAGCASTIVYSAAEPIRSVAAFPGRDDALVVVTGHLVFVLEVDPREPQFFAPLFKGPTIGAAPYSASSTVITNGTTVVEIEL